MAHGGARKGAGRKPKAKEAELIDKLSPFDDIALKALEKAVKQGSSWAIKLFMEYRYGKPKETVSMTHELPTPPKKVFKDFAN